MYIISTDNPLQDINLVIIADGGGEGGGTPEILKDIVDGIVLLSFAPPVLSTSFIDEEEEWNGWWRWVSYTRTTVVVYSSRRTVYTTTLTKITQKTTSLFLEAKNLLPVKK